MVIFIVLKNFTWLQDKCVSWTLSFIWLTFLNCSLGRKFK